MGKRNNDIRKTADTAWGLFEQTGDINYYLLYKKLTQDEG